MRDRFIKAVDTLKNILIGKSSEEELIELNDEINIIVPIAGECFITMEDGTRVWMNSDFCISYQGDFLTDRELKV